MGDREISETTLLEGLNHHAGNIKCAADYSKTSRSRSKPRNLSKERHTPKHWLFGLSRGQVQDSRTEPALNHDDYEQKYPPDAYCEELGPNARVYKVYMDEAAKYDEEAVDSWRDNLDVLLVFAGLFSAVVTTCVVESSSKLDIDWSEMNAHLLAESNAIQRALAAGSPIDEVPSSSMSPSMDFVPKTTDRWINGLWFISLSFSLATALFAVLVKQWLKHYRSTIAGSARDRAHITQSRREALERWRVPTIVGLLPLLLHMSLFMFFAGLAVFLYPLDQTSFRIVTAILAVSFTAYIITTLLPLIFPQCSYVTPLTAVAYATTQSLRMQFVYIKSAFRLLKLSLSARLFPHFRYSYNNLADEHYHIKKALQNLRRASYHQLLELERHSVGAATATWDARVLVWLQSTASLHPTVSPILLQAISGLPVDYPDTLFQTLVKVNIQRFYPNHVKPWTSHLIGAEHSDPRLFYYDKDQATVERYMRACIQFNARLYRNQIWHDDAFDWTHGSLLFSLPYFYQAWRGMEKYGKECQYIRSACTLPWNEVEQPEQHGQSTSRFALIFTAFLRHQATVDMEHADKLHPIIWEQLLLYVINFLSPKSSPTSESQPPSAMTRYLNEEEKLFIKRSGQEILSMLLKSRHADKHGLSIPIFALPWQFSDLGTQEMDRLESSSQPTTLLLLPRHYVLLRFLFLATSLGRSVRHSLTPLESPLHLFYPGETEFVQRLPEYYLITLVQLLVYTPLVETDGGSDIFTTEVINCISYVISFVKGFRPGAEDYTTTEVEYMHSLDANIARTWVTARLQSYITTVRYTQDKLASFICEGEYQNFPGSAQRRFIRALSQCELCLRSVDPTGRPLAFTSAFMHKLIEFMLSIPLLKDQIISIDMIWVENSVFFLLWRSLRDSSSSASEVFVSTNGILAIINGLRISKAQTTWSDTQFEYFTLLVAVVLLGFIQGCLQRPDSQTALAYISSPHVFPSLCGVLFPGFLAHPSYRSKIEPYFLNNNLDLWDTMVALARMDISSFRVAWKEVFERKIALVSPSCKRDHARVEELKDILGLGNVPECTQFLVLRTKDIPATLAGKQQQLTPPQADLVKIDYRLIHPYLDENMEIHCGPPPLPSR